MQTSLAAKSHPHPRLSKLGSLKIIGKTSSESLELKKVSQNGIEVFPKIGDLKFDIGDWSLYHQPTGTNIYENKNGNKKFGIYIDLGSVTFPCTKETVTIQGTIAMIFPWGSFPDQDLDFENLSRCQDRCNAVVEDLGIFQKDSKYYKKYQDMLIPAFCAITVPGIKLENMQIYANMMMSFFFLDDIVDNTLDFPAQSLEPAELHKICGTFCAISTGIKIEPEYLNELPESGFPNFLPVCNLYKLLREEVVALDSVNATYFLQSFARWVEGCFWENQSWTDVEQIKLDVASKKKFYYYNRETNIGALPTLEMVCLIRNVAISDIIRRDPLFQAMQCQVARQMFHANDIFSVKKEIANGEESNILLIRNLYKPAEYCVKKAFDSINNCAKDIAILQRKLDRKYQNDSGLLAYCDIANVWMETHIQWLLLTKRYGEKSFEFRLNV